MRIQQRTKPDLYNNFQKEQHLLRAELTTELKA